MIHLTAERLAWCVLLVLVGEGQEIYKGESAGMDQWVSALARAHPGWEVVALSKLAEDFSHCPSLCRFHARDQLDLNVSAESLGTGCKHLYEPSDRR